MPEDLKEILDEHDIDIAHEGGKGRAQSCHDRERW